MLLGPGGGGPKIASEMECTAAISNLGGTKSASILSQLSDMERSHRKIFVVMRQNEDPNGGHSSPRHCIPLSTYGSAPIWVISSLIPHLSPIKGEELSVPDSTQISRPSY